MEGVVDADVAGADEGAAVEDEDAARDADADVDADVDEPFALVVKRFCNSNQIE
ncbi:MAG: hypothetical protein LBI27_08280 [Clostridiales bacterium]|nr:hypothetical protein [Clostridiales bacterium]